MEWGGKLFVMLCCIHDSVSLRLSLLHNLRCLCTVQNLTPPAPNSTPSTGRVFDLCDPYFTTDSRHLLLPQCEMPFCGSTGLEELFTLNNIKHKTRDLNSTYATVKLFVKPMPNRISEVSQCKLSLWSCCLKRISEWSIQMKWYLHV